MRRTLNENCDKVMLAFTLEWDWSIHFSWICVGKCEVLDNCDIWPVCWWIQMTQTWPHNTVHLLGTCGSPCCKQHHSWSWVLKILDNTVNDNILPWRVSNSTVIVNPQWSWLSVIGGDSQSFSLVNEHIRHPELSSTAGVEGEVRANGVFAVHELFFRCNSFILNIRYLNNSYLTNSMWTWNKQIPGNVFSMWIRPDPDKGRKLRQLADNYNKLGGVSTDWNVISRNIVFQPKIPVPWKEI